MRHGEVDLYLPLAKQHQSQVPVSFALILMSTWDTGQATEFIVLVTS